MQPLLPGCSTALGGVVRGKSGNAVKRDGGRKTQTLSTRNFVSKDTNTNKRNLKGDPRWGKGGNMRGKSGTANYLLNFQYAEHPVEAVASNHPNRQMRRGSGSGRKIGGVWASSTRRNSLSKEQFVQANFSFTVYPYADRMHESFYDPDACVDWDEVEAVRLQIPSSSPVLNDKVWRCPVCLEAPRCPRITRCGHTYCATCILRHLHGHNARQCPMCQAQVTRTGLRHVSVRTVKPFQMSDDAVCDFTLMTRQRGDSIVPELYRAADDGGGRGDGAASPATSVTGSEQTESGAAAGWGDGYGSGGGGGSRKVDKKADRAEAYCPTEGDELEVFSRLVVARPDLLAQRLQEEDDTLAAMREEFIKDGDTEWVPMVTEARELLREEMRRHRQRKGSYDSGGEGRGGDSGSGSFRNRKEKRSSSIDLGQLEGGKDTTTTTTAKADRDAKEEAVGKSDAEEGEAGGKQGGQGGEGKKQGGDFPPLPPPRARVVVEAAAVGVTKPDAGVAGNKESSVDDTDGAEEGDGDDDDGDGEDDYGDEDDDDDVHQFEEYELYADYDYDHDAMSDSYGEGEEDGMYGKPRKDFAAAGKASPSPSSSSYSSPSSSFIDKSVTVAAPTVVKMEEVTSSYAFYQWTDGQKIFLHPLNMKCLMEDAGNDRDKLPLTLKAKVVEVETVKLTKEVRRRFAFLGHLPEHSDVTFVEVDLRKTLSDVTLAKFKPEIIKRQKERKQIKREEAREQALAARAAAEKVERQERQRTFTLDLCGPVPGASLGRAGDDDADMRALLMSGPLPDGTDGQPAGDTVGTEGGNGGGSGGGGGGARSAMIMVPRLPEASFACVTKAGGHFPALGGPLLTSSSSSASASSSAMSTEGVGPGPVPTAAFAAPRGVWGGTGASVGVVTGSGSASRGGESVLGTTPPNLAPCWGGRGGSSPVMGSAVAAAAAAGGGASGGGGGVSAQSDNSGGAAGGGGGKKKKKSKGTVLVSTAMNARRR